MESQKDSPQNFLFAFFLQIPPDFYLFSPF